MYAVNSYAIVEAQFHSSHSEVNISIYLTDIFSNNVYGLSLSDMCIGICQSIEKFIKNFGHRTNATLMSVFK